MRGPRANRSVALGHDHFERLIVQNMGVDRTIELVSTDGWASAKIVRELKSVETMPTAATNVDGSIYVLNSKLNTLFDPNAKKVSDYLLQKF